MKKTAVDYLVKAWVEQGTLYAEDIVKAKEMEKLEKNNYICSKCKCSLDEKDMQQMQNKENT